MQQFLFRICLVISCILSSLTLYACEQSLIRATIISTEYFTPSSSIDVAVMLRFEGNVSLNVPPDLQMAGEWSISCTNFTEGVYAAEDSLLLHYAVDYNGDVFPFYPQNIRFFAAYTDSLQIQSIAETQGHYYFTPYNSLEIYDDIDFYQQPRVWIERQSNQDTSRIYIARDDIPAMNLWACDTMANGEIAEEIQYRRVKGLAYLIPSHPISEDSMAYYSLNIGDATDSAGRLQMAVYTGTISGRIISTVRNDLNDQVEIPISGQIVRLLEQDFWGYEVFGETVTDEMVFFSISYNKWQALEGGNIELWLKVKAKADGGGSFLIKGKDVTASGGPLGKRSWVHHTSINLGLYGTTVNDIIPNQDLQDDHFRVVHWARKGQQYVDANGGSTGNAILDIYPNQGGGEGTFYSPISPVPLPRTGTWTDAFNYVLIHDPLIVIAPGGGDHEGPIRHEFGHFLMWRLQNESQITTIATVPHLLNALNPTRLAWSEGWAGAIGAILDAVYWTEDREYGHNTLATNRLPIYECRIPWDIDAVLNFSNGFRAEYYIATSIYDLWDGAGKNLPAVMTVNTTVDTNIGVPHGWNDTYISIVDATNDQIAERFTSPDNVEFSFQQIIQPLLANQGITPIDNTHNLGNIVEYIQSFLLLNASPVDCPQRADISKLLQQNRLVADIPAYKNKTANTCISTGMPRTFFLHTEIIPPVWVPMISYSEFWLQNYFPQVANETKFITFNDSLNFISEHLWLGGQTLAAGGTTSCLLKMNGSNISESLETCGDAEIYLNEAVLEIGDSHKGELILNAGSELKITEHGKLTIHNNSKVVITANAKLSIEQGAQIELLGNNAILEIQGNLDLKDNAIFTFTGDGFVRFANGNTISAGNNAEMKFMGSSPTDKVVEIADNAHISNYSLAKTTVQNGKCELGEHAFWDTGNGAVLFEKAIFTALDSDKPYQTIYTNGQAPVIRDCAFSYGETGLTARNFMSLGAALGLENVEIHHCNIGLRDYDKGVSLTNVHFHHNFMGWKADYQTFNSTLLNSEIDHNTDAGLSYTGNTYFYVENPYIHHNRYGLDFIGAGNIMPACGSVTFNDETGIGAYQNAKVQLSGNQLYGPKVDMSNNQVSSLFLWGASAYLNEGKNNLSPATGGVALGVLSTSVGNNIPANQNHWNENIIPYGTSPVFGADYNLYKVVNGNAVPLNVIDNQPIDYKSCDGIIKKQLYIPVCEACEIISTTSFSDIRVDDALRQLAEDMYKYTNLQHVVQNYNLLNEILAYEYSEGNKAQDDILNIALDMMKQLFAEGIEKQLIPYNITGEMGQSASKIFQRIDERIANSLDTPTVFYQKIDKAICYNMLQRPALALNLLNDMSTTSTEEADYKAYWTCFMELRNDMQSQNMSSAEIMKRLSACPAMLHPIESDSKMESKNKMATFSICPNPASAETSIALFSPQEAIATLTVYDIQGRKVQEIPAFTCRKGTNLIRLSALTLSNGIYSVVIQLGSEVLSEKWIVE